MVSSATEETQTDPAAVRVLSLAVVTSAPAMATLPPAAVRVLSTSELAKQITLTPLIYPFDLTPLIYWAYGFI